MLKKICLGLLLGFLLVGINGTGLAEAEQTAQINNTESIEDLVVKSSIPLLPEWSRPIYDIALEEKYQELFWDLCLERNLSYELALAVAYEESRFDHYNAKNRNKNGTIDSGIFQINSAYIKNYEKMAKEYGGLNKDISFDVNNIEHNIRAGIGALTYLREKYKEEYCEEELIYVVLGSYNRGEGGYKTYINKNKTLKTSYAEKIINSKMMLEQYGTFKS